MNNLKGLGLPALVVLVALAGCGGGGGPSGSGVTITPINAVVATGATFPFMAQVGGNSAAAVTFRVTEGPTAGSISTSGVYTAPGTPGVYHISATSVADPSQSATVPVTVVASGVSVRLNPMNVIVQPGGSQQFTAIVGGAANMNVQFSVPDPSNGTVSSTGLYTAPIALGMYHVIATSAADQTQTATATITVASATISPSQAIVGPGGTVTFSATLLGLQNNQVTFSVLEPNGGTITPAGVYTAPTNVTTPVTFHVIATSTASPSFQAQAAVTVTTATGITVAISPAMPPTLAPGGQLTFSAAVTGASNPAVTFAVSQGIGTINQQGVYTAPANMTGTATIVASSVVDPTKTSQAMLTVSTTALSIIVSPPAAVISPTPLTASVTPGGTLTVATNIPATLTLQGGAASGTLSNGVYTAPMTPGTFTLTATTTTGVPQSANLVIQVASGSSTVIVQ